VKSSGQSTLNNSSSTLLFFSITSNKFKGLIDKMVSKLHLSIFLLQILSAASAGLRTENVDRELEQRALLSVKTKHAFGKNIKVNFENPNPSKNVYTWIGVFKDTGGLPLDKIPDWSLFQAWLNDCDSQSDCSSVVKKGSVTFSAKDPKSYYYSDYYGYGYGYFPFRQGKYIICYVNDVYEDDDDNAEASSELITNCKRTKVKNPKAKMKKKASIKPLKLNIGVGDAFKAKFNTPVVVVNQWVGLYAEEKGKAPKGDLDGKLILWGYTGCPTHDGDQKETTNCIKKKKKGTVTLNKNSLDDNCTNEDATWPVPPGRYYMCVNFHANTPYNFHKCSQAIEVA